MSRNCASPSENSTASNWPVGSDRPMMPILLPVLVRRSMREITVAATRPALVPPADGAAERRPALDIEPLQRRTVIVERMARQEEADRIIFALQPLRRQPWLERRQRQRRGVDAQPAEQFVLAERRAVMGALRLGENAIGAGKSARAVRLEFVEGAGRGKAFDDALVDRARIDARGEVADAGERRRRPAPRRSSRPPARRRP